MSDEFKRWLERFITEMAIEDVSKSEKSWAEIGFAAGLAAGRAEAKVLVEALEHYYPILRQYGCTRNGDHDDSSWCTELCCDYGKLARQALAAYRKEPRP